MSATETILENADILDVTETVVADTVNNFLDMFTNASLFYLTEIISTDSRINADT